MLLAHLIFGLSQTIRIVSILDKRWYLIKILELVRVSFIKCCLISLKILILI